MENITRFVFDPLFLLDEEGCPVLVPTLKATFDITSNGPVPAVEQVPLLAEGIPWGEPGKSSYRCEPEGTLPKPATDVVLVGSAVAPNSRATESLVALQVGPVRKGVRVVGDRVFYRALGSIEMTKPAPFERIPLRWENAFGGWDRTNPDKERHTFEPRNPVGMGFREGRNHFEEGVRCPNLEDPAHPLRGWGDRPPPAGVGFTSPNWEPRSRLAGTYDEKWRNERAPLLPADFDPRFLNSAAPGLTAAGHLVGNEPVRVTGTTAGGLAFDLPGVAAPKVQVGHAGRRDVVVELKLDTIVLDTDAGKLFLFWRGRSPVREPTAVRSIRVLGASAAKLEPAAAGEPR